MKYTEININEKLFGSNHIIYNWDETEDEIHIYLKSKVHAEKCPACGHDSHKLHATYKRKIQTVPMRMKKTYIHVIPYKYDCINKECITKVFMERLPFTASSQVRTTELTSLILAVSIFLSNEGASKVLDLMGIKVSNDTIKRIYDNISIEDEPDVEEIGIDDVAIRKGQTYATVIYDLKDHHLIALLDGRDAKTLKEWLNNHKKIKLVARDRASAYATAINETLPDCIQVADRFHLLQNLITRMKDIFKVDIPQNIFIKDRKILNHTPTKVKCLKVSPYAKELEQYNYDNDIPKDETGNLVAFDNKKRDMDSKQYKTHAEGRKKNNN